MTTIDKIGCIGACAIVVLIIFGLVWAKVSKDQERP